MKIFKWLTLAVALIAMGLFGSQGAFATSLPLSYYTCGTTTATCDGNLYAVVINSLGGNSYELVLGVLVTNSYTGDINTDYINAISLKDFAQNLALASNNPIEAPGGAGNWTVSLSGLTANGCTGGNKNEACAEAKSSLNSGLGYKLNSQTPDYQLIWVIAFTANQVYDTGHIKYLYVNGYQDNGTLRSVGSLGSWDIGVVPEPTTLLLFGTGLSILGIAAWRRRR